MNVHRRQKRSKKRVRTLPKQPYRLSPEGRRQAGTTPAIKAYVAGFKAKTRLGLAKQIVEDIAKFEKVGLPLEQAKGVWAKRTADQIIRSRKIYKMVRGEAARLQSPAIKGCNECALAAATSLRAAGFKAWIVRSTVHTYAKFVYKGSIWIADPTSKTRPKVRPMTEADKKLEEERKAQGKHAEGASLVQIGLNGYQDFLKYY